MTKLLLQCAAFLALAGCASTHATRSTASTQGIPFTSVKCRNGDTLSVYWDAPGHYVYKNTEYRHGWVEATPGFDSSHEATFYFQSRMLQTHSVTCVVPDELLEAETPPLPPEPVLPGIKK